MFERPNHTDIKTLQEWLDRPEGGDFFLRGREATIWQKEKDLITFSHRKAESDNLTRLINEKLAPWYYYHWGYRAKVCPKFRITTPKDSFSEWQRKTASKDGWDGLWFYEYTNLVLIANMLSVAISSLLPTTSILVLYLLEKPSARLGATMAFTALFPVTLAAVTKATRIDIFAATIA